MARPRHPRTPLRNLPSPIATKRPRAPRSDSRRAACSAPCSPPDPIPGSRPAPPRGQEQGGLHRSPQASGKGAGRPRRHQAPPSVPQPHARTMMAACEQKRKGGTRAGRKPPSSRYCARAEATFCSPDAERLRRTPSPARGRSGMAARQYACAALCRTEEGRGPARHRGVAERLRQLSALAVVDVYDDRDGHVVYILQDFIL